MFHKFSSKLRSKGSGGSSDGQSNKSFAYGKMHKSNDKFLESGGDHSTESEANTSIPWMDSSYNKEERELEKNKSFNFAESIFPVPHDIPVVERAQSFESDVEGDNLSSRSLSFEDKDSKNWGLSSSTQEEALNIGPAVLDDYEDAEEDFLGEYNDYYEHLSVDNVRKYQYPKLDVQRQVYLNYATCGLFSAFQVQEHMRVLLEEGPCLALPETSLDPSNHVPDSQDRLFELLNADRASYSVVFTISFAAGFRLMGNAFPFQRNTPLVVCQDNHEFVRTLISCAAQKGAKPMLAPIRESDLSINAKELRTILRQHRGKNSGGLFIFPAQSCASGVVHPLSWIPEAQQNGWNVLIDTSTYLPTGKLDLSLFQPDFVLGSIAHLLGYPSGFGFLLFRKSVFKVRQAGYDNNVKFVRASDTAKGQDEDRDCLVLDEDNVLNSLAFAAVAAGLTHLDSVGYEAIGKRVRSLTAWLLRTLLSLNHKGSPESPLTRVYGPPNTKDRGNVLAFRVLDSTGSAFPSELVMRLAEKQNIVLGWGQQLCSPGVTNLLGKPSERLKDVSVFELKSSGFDLVRVSLGPMSTFRDVYRLAQFLSRFRDEDYLSREAMGYYEDNPQN